MVNIFGAIFSGILSVLAVLFTVSVCHAAPKTNLIVEVQESSEPKFVVAHDRKSVSGMCADMLRKIEQADATLHFDFRLRDMPLARLIQDMEEGSADANCLIGSLKRTKEIRLVGGPLFSFDYHLIARADDPVSIQNWEDIRKLGSEGKILALSNSGVLEALRQKQGLLVDDGASTVEQNLRKLVAGRARFFYYRNVDLLPKLKLAGVESKVRILPVSLQTVSFNLFLGKSVTPETASRLQTILLQLERDGTLAKIRQEWNGNE